ncbi:hypothetical protein DPMN_157384 [Dreissena polymorpha]|uniref:Uncharacterized protein n=1 Tax=Dreissena polymorpha TaxID=45954 RepID=A0A9D4EH19_DREPO|nr:hypothetical protein DPMN_157384 [Dreissena polymorpha]
MIITHYLSFLDERVGEDTLPIVGSAAETNVRPALFFDEGPQRIAFQIQGRALVGLFHGTKLGLQ